MKNLYLLLTLVAVSLGFSSCCAMFGSHTATAGHRTETHQVRARGHDVVTEQVWVGSAKSGAYETVEKKVPRYRTVTRRVRVSCGTCVRPYCPKKDCCGSTSESTRQMASTQGSSGSPNLGLIPSMKPIAP